MRLELVDVEAHVLERDDVAVLRLLGDGPGLRHEDDVEGAALGPDLDLLLEVVRRLELGRVVGLGGDQVVEDRLEDLVLLGLAGRSGR